MLSWTQLGKHWWVSRRNGANEVTVAKITAGNEYAVEVNNYLMARSYITSDPSLGTLDLYKEAEPVSILQCLRYVVDKKADLDAMMNLLVRGTPVYAYRAEDGDRVVLVNSEDPWLHFDV